MIRTHRPTTSPDATEAATGRTHDAWFAAKAAWRARRTALTTHLETPEDHR